MLPHSTFTRHCHVTLLDTYCLCDLPFLIMSTSAIFNPPLSSCYLKRIKLFFIVKTFSSQVSQDIILLSNSFSTSVHFWSKLVLPIFSFDRYFLSEVLEFKSFISHLNFDYDKSPGCHYSSFYLYLHKLQINSSSHIDIKYSRIYFFSSIYC